MHKVLIKRTFNIGNFESISIEWTGEHEDIQKARLLANKQIIEIVQQDLIRIINVRAAAGVTTPLIYDIQNHLWQQLTLELTGINAELNSH
jgi:hypothetical protein